MAAELVWREQALDDLLAIMEYIASDNRRAAWKYVDALEAACQRLRDFPLIGRRYSSRYRAIVFRNHLIFYRFDTDANVVFITRVVDGRRDVAQVLKLHDGASEPSSHEEPS